MMMVRKINVITRWMVCLPYFVEPKMLYCTVCQDLQQPLRCLHTKIGKTSALSVQRPSFVQLIAYLALKDGWCWMQENVYWFFPLNDQFTCTVISAMCMCVCMDPKIRQRVVSACVCFIWSWSWWNQLYDAAAALRNKMQDQQFHCLHCLSFLCVLLLHIYGQSIWLSYL